MEMHLNNIVKIVKDLEEKSFRPIFPNCQLSLYYHIGLYHYPSHPGEEQFVEIVYLVTLKVYY